MLQAKWNGAQGGVRRELVKLDPAVKKIEVELAQAGVLRECGRAGHSVPGAGQKAY